MSNVIPSTTTTMDFSTITAVHISFSNPLLNTFACGIVPSYDDFFSDDDPSALAEDLMFVLALQVLEVLDVCAGDPARVPALLNKCAYKYHHFETDAARNLRTQADIVECFTSVVRNQQTIVKITVMTNALLFHPDFNGHNLDEIFTTREEMKTYMNSLPSPFSSSIPSLVTPTSLGSSAAITQPPSVPTNEFRHHLLPADVKKRYDDYMNPDVIVAVQDLVPFLITSTAPTRLKYFHETYIAGDKVILRNGAVLVATRDSKKFHKNMPYCTDTSPHGLRVWYKRFVNHGNVCGIFVVPYELLSKSHGGAMGFEFDDDLPSFKSCYCFEWAADILLALQHSSMFPLGSVPAERVKHCDNGYYGIIAILHDSHPAFVTHPISLCKNWPEQKVGQSIFDFHAEFTEAISLRAIFMDDAQDLNSPTMMDTFMHNCLHSEYLLAAVRLDSLDPATVSNTTPGNLAITLNTYLSRSTSPSQVIVPRAPPAPSREGPSSGGYRRRPFARRINVLGEEDDPHYDAEKEAVLDQELPALIHKLAHDGPELRHCMFCGVGHNHLFDKCPILNDSQFLNSFAIRVGSTYLRTLNDAFKRQKAARGITDSPGTPSTSRIHQVFGINPADAPPSVPPVPLHPDFLSADFVPGTGSLDF